MPENVAEETECESERERRAGEAEQGKATAAEQSNLRFVVIFLRLWDAVYTT